MSLFFHRSKPTMKPGTIHHPHKATPTTTLPMEKETPTASPRIPLALQNIFLQSNRGEEVHVPPPKNIASRIFRTLTFRGGRRHHTHLKPNKHRSLRRSMKHPISVSSTNLDHTTTTTTTTTNSTGSSNGSHRSNRHDDEDDEDDPTFIVEVNASTSSYGSSVSTSLDATNPNNNNNNKKQLALNPSTATDTGRSKQYDDIVVVHPSITIQKELSLTVTPVSYVDAILQSRGYTTTRYDALQTSYYNRPTPYQQLCYDTYILKLVKQTEQPDASSSHSSLHALKQLFQAGLSSNPCNAHGESLLHTICRLGTGHNNNNNNNGGHASMMTRKTTGTTASIPPPSWSYELLQLMTSMGKCDVSNCVDDYGRTPLHDACWCNSICYDTIALLLQQDPTLILLQDCRGATPLSYIPSQHHTTFIEFISQYKDQFFPDRTRSKCGPSDPHTDCAVSTPFPSPRVLEPPHSRPVPDPKNALSSDVARMVVSGRITPQELSILLLQDDDFDEDDNDDDESESSYDEDDDDDDEESYEDDDEEVMADDEDDSSTILSAEGDGFVPPQRRNSRTMIHPDKDVFDDDDDDEESYSHLDEMLKRLKSPNAANVPNASSMMKNERDEAVLGIGRPQYGYEMMMHRNQNDDDDDDDVEVNHTKVQLNETDANWDNDVYDETSRTTNEYMKPMSSVHIPTFHCHMESTTGPSSMVPPPTTHLTHSSTFTSPTKTVRLDSVVEMTNELLEFSV